MTDKNKNKEADKNKKVKEDRKPIKFGYCRVSTENQELDKYKQQLKENGVEEKDIYEDKITGTTRNRPGLNELFDKIQEKDTIIVPDITRLSRSTRDLLSIVEELKDRGVHLKSIKDTWLDTGSSTGTFILTIMSGLAQMERDLIAERTKMSLDYKKKMNGGKSVGGRAPKDLEIRNTIIKMYTQGTWTISEIGKNTNCSRNTVYKYIREAKKEGKIK